MKTSVTSQFLFVVVPFILFCFCRCSHLQCYFLERVHYPWVPMARGAGSRWGVLWQINAVPFVAQMSGHTAGKVANQGLCSPF